MCYINKLALHKSMLKFDYFSRFLIEFDWFSVVISVLVAVSITTKA